jgi:hypothetical protein
MGFIIRRFITRPKGALTYPNPGIWDPKVLPDPWGGGLWYYGLDPINFIFNQKITTLGKRVGVGGRRYGRAFRSPGRARPACWGSAVWQGLQFTWPGQACVLGVGGMAGPSGHLVGPGRVGQACGAGRRGKDGRRAAAIDRPSWHEGGGLGEGARPLPQPSGKVHRDCPPGRLGVSCSPASILVGPPGPTQPRLTCSWPGFGITWSATAALCSSRPNQNAGDVGRSGKDGRRAAGADLRRD